MPSSPFVICFGILYRSERFSLPNALLPAARSIRISKSFRTTTAASGVGWQAVRANTVNIESKIAVNLFIVTSLIAQGPVYYAAVYGVDGEHNAMKRFICISACKASLPRSVEVPNGD